VQQHRTTLACLVVCVALQEPDVLLLDEPTNHLDLDAIEWLEGYLKQQVGATVYVQKIHKPIVGLSICGTAETVCGTANP
jgi:ABC-type cobalamin/Fe3+-siderophores transport system ATPase subunit